MCEAVRISWHPIERDVLMCSSLDSSWERRRIWSVTTKIDVGNMTSTYDLTAEKKRHCKLMV